MPNFDVFFVVNLDKLLNKRIFKPTFFRNANILSQNIFRNAHVSSVMIGDYVIM